MYSCCSWDYPEDWRALLFLRLSRRWTCSCCCWALKEDRRVHVPETFADRRVIILSGLCNSFWTPQFFMDSDLYPTSVTIGCNSNWMLRLFYISVNLCNICILIVIRIIIKAYYYLFIFLVCYLLIPCYYYVLVCDYLHLAIHVIVVR